MTPKAYIETNMKKIGRAGLLGTLATSMVLSLASCGSTDPAATAATATIPPPVMSTETTGTTDQTTPTTSSLDIQASPSASTSAGTSAGNEAMVQATLKEWSLDLSQKEVAAGKVKFVVTNAGQFPHNFTVTDSNGQVGKTTTFKSADGQQVLEVDLKPGTYTVMCSLPGHAARGQKNEIVVK